jgi:hypothetical protein
MKCVESRVLRSFVRIVFAGSEQSTRGACSGPSRHWRLSVRSPGDSPYGRQRERLARARSLEKKEEDLAFESEICAWRVFALVSRTWTDLSMCRSFRRVSATCSLVWRAPTFCWRPERPTAGLLFGLCCSTLESLTAQQLLLSRPQSEKPQGKLKACTFAGKSLDI